MKYETSPSDIYQEHEIQSANILCCGETGRVIAVFYNDYDLKEITDMEKENAELKRQIKQFIDAENWGK